MGQAWRLVDLDGEVDMRHGDGSKIMEFFWSRRIDIGLINLLLVKPSPVAGMADTIWPHAATTSRTLHHATTPKLLTLANELLLAIFAELENLRDVICLALAHEHLGSIAGSRLCQLISAELSPWIGHRLICIGEYTSRYPKWLTPIIKRKLVLAKERNLFGLANNHFTDISAPHTGRLRGVANQIQSTFRRINLTVSERDLLDKFIAILVGVNDSAPGPLDSIVLCNLSKHVYVRASLVKKKFGKHASLGTLLLSHICWSGEGCGRMERSRHPLSAGRWTGHRFEITTLDKMRPGIEWKEVSMEYVSHLEELWETRDL